MTGVLSKRTTRLVALCLCIADERRADSRGCTGPEMLMHEFDRLMKDNWRGPKETTRWSKEKERLMAELTFDWDHRDIL